MIRETNCTTLAAQMLHCASFFGTSFFTDGDVWTLSSATATTVGSA